MPEIDYEADYFAAVATVQSMFAGTPTPGEVVRAIERLGWLPTWVTAAKTQAEIAEYIDDRFGHICDGLNGPDDADMAADARARHIAQAVAHRRTSVNVLPVSEANDG